MQVLEASMMQPQRAQLDTVLLRPSPLRSSWALHSREIYLNPHGQLKRLSKKSEMMILTFCLRRFGLEKPHNLSRSRINE